MAGEQVRVWRPRQEEGILLMAGETTGYSIEPRGDYIFGVIAGEAMKARRGRETHLVRPGELVAWDPGEPHAGTAAGGRPWSSRLMVVEGGDLARLVAEEEDDHLANISFPSPVLRDPRLVACFLHLHTSLEQAGVALEQDELLTGWLGAVVGRGTSASSSRRFRDARDDRALRLAAEYLLAHSTENIRLDELAVAAGVGKFRLVRLFRERTGLPPHALQLAHRLRVARRLLEAGESVAATAALTGFSDQSHLHRHFRRGIGMTPGAYRRRARLDR